MEMKMTIKEKLKAALGGLGWRVDRNHRSRKYLAMSPPADSPKFSPDARYFLGTAGALRYSLTGSSAFSVPHEKTKQRLLGLARETK